MAVNVGLDIGTSAVRAALVNAGKGTPTPQRSGEVALPPGAVVGGEIVDEDLVQGALSRLWKTVKLPKKRVILGIANQRVIVRRVDLPYMAEDELAESLAQTERVTQAASSARSSLSSAKGKVSCVRGCRRS